MTYSKPVLNQVQKPKETKVFRCPLSLDELEHLIAPTIQNLQDVAENSFIHFSHYQFLGTRKENPDGSPGDYQWKTYQEIYNSTRQLGSGILHLDLAPTLREYKDFELKLIGIFCKNTEEWIVLDSTAALFGFTIVIYCLLKV